jgi:uncharacterized protein (DUF4415 family)
MRLGEGLDQDRTNWEGLRGMTDEEIEQAAKEDPDSDIEEDWTDARLVIPLPKQSIHLRVDPEVLAWFKAQGPGHLSRMNAVLRIYYEAHKAAG